MDQESQKLKRENTPIFCANNCGFFGSSQTSNLCSKCYREFLLKQPKSTPISDSKLVHEKDDDFLPPIVVNESQQGNESSSVAVAGASEVQAVANRCSFCSKRMRLTGFKCRCGNTFCSQHRYSDKHNCAFDYKSAGQDAIAKANPVVKADKIDKI